MTQKMSSNSSKYGHDQITSSTNAITAASYKGLIKKKSNNRSEQTSGEGLSLTHKWGGKPSVMDLSLF